MPLVPLDLKAGFYRNGTEFDASNRWRDGSLVRWRDGSLRPIGGWQTFKSGFCTICFVFLPNNVMETKLANL